MDNDSNTITADVLATGWTIVSTQRRDRDGTRHGFDETLRRYPDGRVAACVYCALWEGPTAYVQTLDGEITPVTPATKEACDAQLAAMEMAL